MKITLERLREIVTEEVIKEELAPEIAAPAIAAMLQGTDSVDTSEIFGAVFDQMYGEGALEGEAERMASAEEAEEEEFPTEYQAGGAEGDRPTMGFKENLAEIIEEEISKALYGINEGCGDDPAQQLADQLGINVAELVSAMEQMGLNIVSSGAEAGDPMEDDYAWGPSAEDYGEEPMMEMRRFDPTQELGAQGLSRDETLYYEPEEEGLPPQRQLAVIRGQIGNMSYEIEKMLIALLKAGYSQEDIINMAIQLKRMDPHPEDVQVAEEKEKDNPWAICTASVGREDKEKYEKCVKSVKKEKGIE